MKLFFPIFFSALVCAGPATADEAESMVRFSNDDRLAGSMTSLTAERLTWDSPVFDKPASFFLKDVIDLSLPTVTPGVPADHVATLKLTNGDTVRGQLASVTDETVSLDTWYAGRLNFSRLMVAGLKIEGAPALLYQGPAGLDGWKQSADPPAWSYSRGAFLSDAAGSIARDDVLPDECSVSFDAAWKSESFSFKVILFSSDPASTGNRSGYELYFQRGNVTLRNCKIDGYIGNTHSQVMMENEKVRVEIRASKKSGKVCLFINDRILEVWTDPDVAKGDYGRCLHFVSQNTLPVRISGICVAPWDGVVERLPEPRGGMLRQFGMPGLREDAKPAPEEKPKEGRMELANGDSLEGEVNSIQDGMIAVKTPLGDIKVPVARLRTVALKKSDLERCKRRNGDIRGWFPDGTSIVFRLDGVTGDSITGSSQNFGSATFKIAAFNRMEFNIYEPGLEDKRRSEEW